MRAELHFSMLFHFFCVYCSFFRHLTIIVQQANNAGEISRQATVANCPLLPAALVGTKVAEVAVTSVPNRHIGVTLAFTTFITPDVAAVPAAICTLPTATPLTRPFETTATLAFDDVSVDRHVVSTVTLPAPVLNTLVTATGVVWYIGKQDG
jgi:hypothetical protein